MDNRNHVLGVDVGGSGMKAAIVDITNGELVSERLRVETPQPSTPDAMTRVFAQLYERFDYQGDHIGVGFPTIVRNGTAMSAANIDKRWIGTSIVDRFESVCGLTVHAVNDADAAGIASMRFGSASKRDGVILFLTIGTGIGSALFIENVLVPNTELGHLHMPNGLIAEHYASNKVRKDLALSWEDWARRFDDYLHVLDRLFSPDHVLLGGGASKYFHLYEEYLTAPMDVGPAAYQNNAGIVGAALNAAQYHTA